jgi:uncharacterized DUF497 family protein
VEFAWGSKKAEANGRKRGVEFVEVVMVFDDDRPRKSVIYPSAWMKDRDYALPSRFVVAPFA